MLPSELISQPNIVNPQFAPDARRHDHDLGVPHPARQNQALDIKLVELAVAAFLRALVAEHFAQRVDAQGPLHVRFDSTAAQGPDRPSVRGGAESAFRRSTCPRTSTSPLFDDIGDLTD